MAQDNDDRLRAYAWEIFEQVARGGEADRVPVALLVDSSFLPGLYQLNTLDYFLYPRTWLRAQITLSNRFPEVVFLPGFWTEYGHATEASAFGAGVQWRHDRQPIVRPLSTPPERWGDLPSPDPYTDGLMALALRHTWKLEKEGELPAPYRLRFAAVRGPLSVAASIFGASRLMAALTSHPESVTAALTTITHAIGQFLNAQLAALRHPVGLIILDDTLALLNGDQFFTFARPHLLALFTGFEGLLRVLHVATPCKPLLPTISRLPFELFHCGYVTNLTDVKATLGPKGIAIMGNVAPGAILANGTKEQIASAAKECIARAGKDGGFILSAGGPVARGTAPSHISSLVEVTHT